MACAGKIDSTLKGKAAASSQTGHLSLARCLTFQSVSNVSFSPSDTPYTTAEFAAIWRGVGRSYISVAVSSILLRLFTTAVNIPLERATVEFQPYTTNKNRRTCATIEFQRPCVVPSFLSPFFSFFFLLRLLPTLRLARARPFIP